MFVCLCNKITDKQWQEAAEEACGKKMICEDNPTAAVWTVLEKQFRCGRCVPYLEEKTRQIIKLTPV